MKRTEPGIRYHDKLTGRLFLNGRMVGQAKPKQFPVSDARQLQDEYWDNLHAAKKSSK